MVLLLLVFGSVSSSSVTPSSSPFTLLNNAAADKGMMGGGSGGSGGDGDGGDSSSSDSGKKGKSKKGHGAEGGNGGDSSSSDSGKKRKSNNKEGGGGDNGNTDDSSAGGSTVDTLPLGSTDNPDTNDPTFRFRPVANVQSVTVVNSNGSTTTTDADATITTRNPCGITTIYSPVDHTEAILDSGDGHHIGSILTNPNNGE